MGVNTRSRRGLKKAAVLITVLALLLAACGGGEEAPAAQPEAPGPQPEAPAPEPADEVHSTLIGAQVGDISDFDPYTIGAVARVAIRQMFDSLVEFNGTDFEPRLATSWEFSDDFSRLTFQLREGVKFHSGADFTAESVAANVARAQDDTLAHPLVGSASSIVEVEQVGDYEVTIHLAAPQPAAVTLELFDAMPIIDHTKIDVVLDDPSGAGPYRLTEWTPGDRAVFTRFEDYWEEGLPITDEIIYRIFADPASMVLSYRGGELDWINNPPGPDLQALDSMDNSDVLVIEGPGLMWCICIHTQNPPMNDAALRRALAHAINREAIANNVLFGYSAPIAAVFYRDDDALFNAAQASEYEFNLERAQELFAEAGEPDFTFTAQYGSQFPELGGMLQIVQADLATIGITMEVEELEGSAFSEIWSGGTYGVVGSATANPQRDPSWTFGTPAPLRAHSGNNAGFFDAEYQELHQLALTELDESVRLEHYARMRDILHEEAWIIPMATRPVKYALRADLVNFRTSPNDSLILRELYRPLGD